MKFLSVCKYIYKDQQSYGLHSCDQRFGRGDADIKSVKYLQKQIQHHEQLEPIWLYSNKKHGYYLLDGAHRIVASYIEGVKYVDAYVIDTTQ